MTSSPQSANDPKIDPQPAAALSKVPAKAVTADQVRRAFETGRYPYRYRMSRRTYEVEKAALQAELL
ncbi:MAG: polyphosphate kinase 2, partial [Marivita lacus]|nr:polyphosphate kinase 2 [Marivita lacus]